MRTKLFLLVLAAAVVASGAAFSGTGAARSVAGGVRYSFLGKLTAVPGNGHIAISVEGGNRPALRALLGKPVTQTFTYGDDTEFLKWSNGIPSVVHAGDLASGDYVRIHVRQPAGASLETIEQTDAGIVGDHGPELSTPDKPLYLFRGKITAVGFARVSVHVAGGDRRAMRLLIGESADQTFSLGDSTIFLLWQGKVPTVIDRTDLKVGDSVTIRVRAEAHSTLPQVESTPAVKVAEHEPASQS